MPHNTGGGTAAALAALGVLVFVSAAAAAPITLGFETEDDFLTPLVGCGFVYKSGT